jgi:hypothetical protein
LLEAWNATEGLQDDELVEPIQESLNVLLVLAPLNQAKQRASFALEEDATVVLNGDIQDISPRPMIMGR